ncbi:MAG: homocysteine methyltransferase [Firmicutes bacterium HGW-Firmicutes-16]|nr:MAG: homocysteine methyltransferase [Firmicutes bacterium HGW-Firmicutes-16]
MDELFKSEFVILDGAMGTMLQRAGLPVGMLPELFTLEHPDILESIHKAYIEAGSQIAYSNTFSSNAYKLKDSDHTVEEVIMASVSAAKKAANGKVPVALDLGPIGEMLEPSGTLTFEKAYELHKEMLIAGEKAGADLIAFETFTDLAELRIAVLAAKENTSLPIFATMSFEESGRTFTGALAEAFAVTMTGLGVDAIGVNCSMGPQKLMPIIRRIGAVSPLPLIVKANAGLPDARDGHYNITASEFAAEMAECAEIGVRFIGGCCGTDPDYIAALRDIMLTRKCAPRTISRETRLCSITKLVTVDEVRIIGERINPTGKKRFQQALRENDLDYVLAQGVAQADAGADILDVNVGVPGLNEVLLMKNCVKGLQSTVDLPLQIDSNDSTAIETGLRAFCGKAIVNSVNGEAERLEKVLPLVKKYGAAVIGLTMDEHGIPETAEERFEIARRILRACESYGIPKRDVFIDCLCLTVSASQSSAAETLKAVRMVKEKLGLHTVLGVSNISFGLPNRELINSTFLTLAMENGLDLPIVNPNISAMTDAIATFKLLRGFDTGCQSYVERFSNVMSTAPTDSISTSSDISETVAKGLKAETKAITQSLLETKSELEIINELLIPALDAVGERYEKGEIFLPQLMRSADAACEAFEVLKLSIAKNGGNSVSKGKIIIATVKGDIHDIGKNIVKTILANYGYQLLDLGRDVSTQTVVETAIREDVRLVGLSALMTTTLPAMEQTIKALRNSGHDCKIMVGGAVLTEEYAKEIGADYYAKDAKRAVDIAKEVLG